MSSMRDEQLHLGRDGHLRLGVGQKKVINDTIKCLFQQISKSFGLLFRKTRLFEATDRKRTHLTTYLLLPMVSLRSLFLVRRSTGYPIKY